MADKDLNTETSGDGKADEAAAKAAFNASFIATGNRDSDFHAVGGNDDSTGDNDDAGGEGDAGDEDQGAGAGDGQDDNAGAKNDDGKQGQGEKEPTIKDVIAMVQGMENKISTKLTREVGGMMGRIDQRLKPMEAAKQVAATATENKGKDVPNKERVAEALKSVEGFADLKKDFPDYAAVLEAGLSLVADMGTGNHKPIDENALVTKVADRIQQNTQQQQAAQQAQEAEFAKIESAWTGWKEDINSKPFADWAAQKLAGPEGAEYKRIFDSGSTRETISVLNEFGQETGVKPKAKLDDGGKNLNQQSNANKDRQRRAAARPQGSATAAPAKTSAEEIFHRTFKERSGG